MKKEQNSKQSLSSQLYKTLVSMKFAIIILIVLGATSLLSMLINEYPNFFTEDSLLHKLFQQHSPYSSWWYTILLWFLVVSVLLCIIQNLRPTLNSILNFRFLSSDKINNIDNAKQVKLGKQNKLELIRSILKKQLYSVKESVKDGENLFVARKFRWSALGHLLTHLSLLIIVLGSLIYTRTDRQEF